jgi:hypothetical protein
MVLNESISLCKTSNLIGIITTLTLGLQPKQGHGKVQAKSHIHTFESVGECERMSSHIPKWTPILGIGVPMDS